MTTALDAPPLQPLERSIIFTLENIDRVLLPEDQFPKNMTRRVIKTQTPGVGYPYRLPGSNKSTWAFASCEGRSDGIDWKDEAVHHRYGPVGTHLYIQEPTRVLELRDTEAVVQYLRDSAELIVPITTIDRQKLTCRRDYTRPCSARFMLKSFAREWVRVTDVDIQSLQQITPIDCLREGVHVYSGIDLDLPGQSRGVDAIYLDAFIRLWDSIHPPTRSEFHWGKNPWVFATSFQRIQNVRVINHDPEGLRSAG